MRRAPIYAVLVAVPALLAGCSEYDLRADAGILPGDLPFIQVTPQFLQYDLLTSTDDQVQSFMVKNIGGTALHVSDVTIDLGFAFEVLGPTTFVLAPDEEIPVEVGFTPMGADENYGRALVMSDDPDKPEVPVDLVGTGAVPNLQITPNSYVFEDAVVPCGGEVDLELRNVGAEVLVIEDWTYRSGGLLVLDDSNLRSQLPIRLQPNETRTMTVSFTPTSAGADTGILDVISNDPRRIVSADQNGEGSYLRYTTEQFLQPGIVPVDVLMLIDHSCSMRDDNEDDVINGIPSFIEELGNVADWHLLQVTREDGCSNGGVIDADTPNVEQYLIDHAWDQSGGGGGGGSSNLQTEALLELASDALDQTDPGQCNKDFLRQGALLHVITISDEPEQSGRRYDHWLGEFEQHVVAPEFVTVSGVLDIYTQCGEGPDEYDEAATATGGSILDICNADWGSELSQVASDVVAGIRTYNLAGPTAADSIVVTVNGNPTTDFAYSSAGNSVTILSPAIGEGDVVEITYAVYDEC